MLKEGSTAPAFKTKDANGESVSLKDLRGQKVVLYFYPAAFTSGCTIEAHEFAEAMGKFQALGAAVIGVSSDNIATLDKFSTSECRSKFPVAADGARDLRRRAPAGSRRRRFDSVELQVLRFVSTER